MASSIYRLGNLSPQAVAAILCSLPLAAGMFYILSAKTEILASRPRDYLNDTRCSPSVQLELIKFSLWNADPPGLGIILCVRRTFPANRNNLGRRHCIEEEVQAEGTDDIVGNDYEQSLGDEIPALRIAKLRHKLTNSKAQHEDQGEAQHIQFVDHSSDIRLHGKKPFRKGEWKPDAPEFIPIAQQRIVMQQLDGNRDQQIERQQELGLKELQYQGLDEEGVLSRTVNSQMAKSAVPSFPITDENESPRPAASTKHRNHAAEGGSSQSTTGSQQASDRVIIAYPKKARKRGKRSRKEAISRRKGTKSEPAGIGLTTDIDHT
ncbi:hypothetical protein ALT_1761 [Aspergillus lentulus]|uniref:Uncharacterized protein n=1 Tax=Aspergillus lentulus TaxID=293939 RepID=A0AAN4PD71_ASPLE|nr:hypothetical protein CNMCM8060_002633 [Aspergillus lentulus]KAF4180050.1 hypothetical protein CNMCM7927_001478 [Aspergillus lentulus]GAQ04440.1 hypothetical protein ALT_1761 [Aspergillus lentulus]